MSIFEQNMTFFQQKSREYYVQESERPARLTLWNNSESLVEQSS